MRGFRYTNISGQSTIPRPVSEWSEDLIHPDQSIGEYIHRVKLFILDHTWIMLGHEKRMTNKQRRRYLRHHPY